MKNYFLLAFERALPIILEKKNKNFNYFLLKKYKKNY